jgi:type IV pilus assembly protein PilC
MSVVGIVMMVFVLPKLTSMYQDFNAELPAITKALINFSNFLNKYWYVMIVGVFGTIYGLRMWKKTKSGAVAVDQLTLKIPIYGKIRLMVMMAEFSRTLALLASAGVSLVESLGIVKDVVDSVILSQSLVVIAKDVEKGNPLATSLAKHPAFPMIISQMVAVGEQTGKLDEILNRVAVYFEVESEHAIKNLSTAMEPLIMILLGVGVGFLIVAIIVPIYNLTSAF